jgi:hypothetical protein
VKGRGPSKQSTGGEIFEKPVTSEKRDWLNGGVALGKEVKHIASEPDEVRRITFYILLEKACLGAFFSPFFRAVKRV